MNQLRLLVAVYTCALSVVSLPSQAVGVSGLGTWESTLQGRDLDGNTATFEAYYDTTLDITWLADANAAGTMMTWADASTWAASLDINGVTGWRLPSVAPINSSTFNLNITNNATTDQGYASGNGWVDGSGNPVSEMGHMFYVSLGNLGQCTPDNSDPSGCTSQPGWGLSNTGPFSGIQDATGYWSESEQGSSSAWGFSFFWGNQAIYGKSSSVFTWAVHSGDVSAVPVPSAVWLFGSGLLGLVGMVKHKKA